MINLKYIKLLLVLTLLPFKVWANNSVGTPNGEVSVNENGAAVYNVPIDIYPSGTGFDPTISLTYNSQLMGYGNVGYGISITGISSITRVGKDRFHDNDKIQKVKYEAGDNYALDGKRLYLKTGTTGADGSTYTIEGNPYATVTLHGNDTQTNRNIWFEVKEADGNTYQFKQRLECYVGHPNKTYRTVAWYISKATNKNYDDIDYSYVEYSNVLYPLSITYGRNNVTDTIKFSYTDIAEVQRFTMEGGSIGYISKKLSSITSKCQSQIYRKYTLSYNTTADASERKYERLTTINVSNGSEESLKPVNLSWNYLKSASINKKCIEILNDLESKWYEKNKYFLSADINGDGFSDFIRFSICGRYEKTRIVITYSISSIDKASRAVTYQEKVSEDFRLAFDGDWRIFGGNIFGFLDEDNCADLILPASEDLSIDRHHVIKFFIFPGNEISTKDKVDLKAISYNLKSGNEIPLYHLFDFNGDGKDELIFLEKKKYGGYFYGNIDFISRDKLLKPDSNGYFDYSKTTQGNTIKLTYSQDKEIKKMFLADCNADGLQDLILLFDGGHKIYFNNGGTNLSTVFTESNAKEVTSGSQLKDYWRMEQGDFNNDGLADFVVIAAGESKLSFLCNDGNGSFSITGSTDVDFSENTDSDEDDKYFTIRVVDFDKDGYSDVFVSKKHQKYDWDIFGSYYRMDKTQVRLFRSDGYKPVLWKQLDKADEERDCAEAYIFTGDFNGDGYLEIANYGSPLNDKDDNTFKVNGKTHINVYSFSTDVALGHLASITNGFGKKTTITYASGTNPSVYTAGNPSDCSFPVKTYTLPLPLVSKVSQTNGAAGTQYLSYSYGDMRVHVKGRGMLGFTSMTVDNTTLGSKTETKVTGWNKSKYLPTSVISTTTIGGKTSETQIKDSIIVDNTWNGNYFSYCKEKLSTDFDGHQIKTKYSYNLTNGVLTDERNYYDGKTDMYKNTKFSGHILDYAGKYHPTSITYAQRHSDDNGNLSKVTHNYTYDKGEIIKDEQVSWYGNKSITLTTTYTRDDYGNVLTEVTSGSNVIAVKKCYEYDDNHLRIVRSYTDPASVVTTYKYDSWGNLISKSNETDASNILSTTYTYDKWGNLIKTVNPDGTYTSVTTEWDTTPTNDGSTYGSVYKTVTCASAQAPVTVYYDSEGREVNSSTIGLDGVNITKVTHYDSKGNVAHVVNTTGQLQTSSILSYDAFGRLTSQKNSDGSYIENTYGDRTVTVKTPTGNVIKTYDAWGNITNIKDQIGKDVAYKYYSNGKPSSIETNGNKVTQEYDAAGNRIKMVDPDAGTMTYTYASDGTLLSETDARGVTTTYTYDRIGRLSKRVYNDKTSNNITDIYIYCTGAHIYNIARQRRGNKYKYYEYDPYGRITSIKSEVPETSTTKTYITSYKYNNDGLKSEVTYPGNVVFNYNYDSNGFLSEILLNNSKSVYSLLEYDGLVLKTNTVAGIMEKTVDSDGYDYKYQLHGKDYQEFAYDKTTGNLLSRYWKNGNTVMLDESFKYDKLDRLMQVYSGGKTILSMDYHPNGNIVEKSDIGWYNYETKRAHAVTNIDRYNKNIDDELVQTTFDLNGKISKISKSNYGAMTFVYGPDNEKIYSRDPNIGEHIYLGNYEKIIKNKISTEYYFLENDVIVTRKTGTSGSSSVKVYQAVTDNLGNILAVYGETNNLVFKAKYDAWGKQTVYKNDISLYYGYTGHEMLPGFDLINMIGRLYDPVIGRFLSCDNFVQAPDNSQNFNRYSYCLNNPLRYTDPTGENFIGWGLAVVGAYFGGSMANNWQWNPGKWNYSSAGTYLGMGIGAFSGGLSTLSSASVSFNVLAPYISVGVTHGGTDSYMHGWSFNWMTAAGRGGRISKHGYSERAVRHSIDTQVENIVQTKAYVDRSLSFDLTFSSRIEWDFSSCLAVTPIATAIAADDASGVGIVDDLAIPLLYAGAFLYDNHDKILPQIQASIALAFVSMTAMQAKTRQCRPGYVYHLVAQTDGYYPNVRGKDVFLKAGETWKIGETINGKGRYGSEWLKNHSLDMIPSSDIMTDKYQLWIEEKRQLIDYASKNGCLPPGNKIFK